MLFKEGKLQGALKANDVEFAKKCIKSGAVCSKSWLELFLSESVFFNDIEHIQTYLKCGLNIEGHVNDDYETMLHLAARIGRTKVVNFLIANGAEVNTYNILKRSALYDTAHHHSPVSANIIKTLVQNGAPIDYQDTIDHKTALIVASENNNAASVQALIDLGADLDLTDNKGNTAWNISRPETAFLFPQYKRDPDEIVKTHQKWTWKSRSENAITHSQLSDSLKGLLIDVFNFSTQKVYSISTNENMKVKEQSTQLFAEYPDKEILRTACIEYNQLSGTKTPVNPDKIFNLTVKIIDGVPTNKVKVSISI